MGLHLRNLFTVLFIVSIFINSGFATRPLEGEQWLKEVLGLESLQKGPVPPSGASPCTHIPGTGRGRCTLDEMNFAGHVARAPPAFPEVIVTFAAASVANETHQQDSSS